MNGGTLLLRQIHPNFVQNGRVASVAFRPNDSDEGLLSVYDGDLIECEKAWKHYTDEQQLKSAGVCAVTVSECAAVDLLARPDPETFPSHALVDFTAHEKRAIDKKAKELRSYATARGWAYQPPPPPSV